MTKKTSFNNLSLQRQTYIRQQKHYHAIITFVRLFILAGFIALWEISAATGIINPLLPLDSSLLYLHWIFYIPFHWQYL